jgi:plastocyanin
MTHQSSQPIRFAVALLALLTATLGHSDTWQMKVGAQTSDRAHQGFAFLPNEIWIHAGDSVTWTVATDENHTVTFLTPGQVRPPFQVGCPGTTPDGSLDTGTSCIYSGVLNNGNTYTVTFPVTGNFKLVCLIHANMTATVHVLDLSAPLPHDQSFYDEQGNTQRSHLLSDLRAPGDGNAGPNTVTVGAGKIMATGGGSETGSIVRFLEGTTTVHVGDTVEWTNVDAVTPHTVTFGPQPANLPPPSPNVTLDADGARHATISSPSDVVHSGFVVAAPQERIGLGQAALSVTRFRVTFTQPGVFNYKCSLHGDIGMVGEVIVLP